ncbi:6263_t:CDS:2 [Funneliformis caledonium]|uniref:6263_t:CDS:1 n=1 Tax=Funneliformis caledonium TaxID=1117310 RepID=A0A9N8W860_9GLOM|nr:6263_t:CDS:2 [Funneliformis caledonium]
MSAAFTPEELFRKKLDAILPSHYNLDKEKHEVTLVEVVIMLVHAQAVTELVGLIGNSRTYYTLLLPPTTDRGPDASVVLATRYVQLVIPRIITTKKYVEAGVKVALEVLQWKYFAVNQEAAKEAAYKYLSNIIMSSEMHERTLQVIREKLNTNHRKRK